MEDFVNNSIKYLLVIALGYIVWSLKKILHDHEKFFEDLYGKYNSMKERLDTLQGEHNILTCRRKTDPHE